MDTQRVGDLTKAELRSIIAEIVDERLGTRSKPYVQQSDRPISEILESMRRNLIERQPGEPSVPDMIREERDR